MNGAATVGTIGFGEPAPWFIARSTTNPQYHFNSVAGRHIVLCFLGSASDDYSRAVLAAFRARQDCFDDRRASFFGVSTDAEDERSQRLQQALPGFRYFWDFERELSKLYRVWHEGAAYRRCTYVIDAGLRVIAVFDFDPALAPEQYAAKVVGAIHANEAVAPSHAPVLIVQRVFEPAFCRQLIDYYQRGTPEVSGFMREREGKTVGVLDDRFKRRRDVIVKDTDLRLACRVRLATRLAPEVKKAFQFVVKHAERYIVSCYDAAERGFFKAHRDNTTKGTAHRKFAVTINLNTGEYEGGALRFPEFGSSEYVAPLGGAVVFSCSLLHEALPVTRGVRYAFLPFFYDDAGAKIRERNMEFVDAKQ